MREKLKLETCQTKLFAYSNTKPIPVLGQFTTIVSLESSDFRITFIVVKGETVNLIGYDTARKLNLFQKEMFKTNLCTLNSKRQYEKLIHEFKDVFTDKVGRLKDFKVKFYIDKNVKPVHASYRRLPYNLIDATDRELNELLANDIIELAPGLTPWVSQMVVVPKPKMPGKVRITTDMRQANKAIIRERFATPTLEEIMYDLQGATAFSEIDLNKAFHQIELDDEDTKNITAFETHRGIYRFKVLNMGVHNASELLQKAMKLKILVGLKGVKGIADNCIVFGSKREIHDSNLRALCERFRKLGITASVENCKLGVQELNFFGLKISDRGVAIAPSKIEALT